MAGLTLEKTLASQKDLSKLCADRPLETKEFFSPNAFYGIDFVIKKYTGLPQDYPLKVVYPHGLRISNKIWNLELETYLPVIAAYRENYKDILTKANKDYSGCKFVCLSASPFLYVLELVKEHPKPRRNGMIFFPAHSSHHVTVQMNFESLAEELVNLDDQYQPVTVCMYWRDFNLGHHLPFQKRGLRIVSAGHIFDPLFLFRFYHLCSMHYYSAGNSFSSSLFFSIKSGCSYFHLDTVGFSRMAESHILKRDVSPPLPEQQRALKALFKIPQPFMTKEQMKVVDYYLGVDYLKSPKELRQQLFYADILDWIGVVVYQKGQPIRFSIPTFFQRNAARAVRLARRVGRKGIGFFYQKHQ